MGQHPSTSPDKGGPFGHRRFGPGGSGLNRTGELKQPPIASYRHGQGGTASVFDMGLDGLLLLDLHDDAMRCMASSGKREKGRKEEGNYSYVFYGTVVGRDVPGKRSPQDILLDA